MINLRALLPMIPGVFNDGETDEAKRALQKRLADELLTRGNAITLGGMTPPIADNPIPALTRQPMVDVGAPPPPDPNWQMEALSRNMPQPSYATGEATYPTRNLPIPAPYSMPEPAPVPIADTAAPLARIGMNRPIGAVSTEGMTPLQRAMLVREITANADPNSRINTKNPNYIDEGPPQKRSRLKSFLAGAGLGALRGLASGGLGGAIGGALTGGAIGGISPDTLSRFQRQEDLDRQDTEIARQYGQQKAVSGLQDAETERLYKLNRIDQGDAEAQRKAAHDAATLKLEREKLAGTITKDEADRQQKVLDREERATYHKGILDRTGGVNESTNTAVDQNIQEASTERDRIAESLKTIPPTIDSVVTDPYTLEQTKKQVPNPAYTDLMDRYRNLDDDIRGLRLKKKPTLIRNTGGGSYSEADVTARAVAAGKDPAAAIALAKSKGLLK